MEFDFESASTVPLSNLTIPEPGLLVEKNEKRAQGSENRFNQHTHIEIIEISITQTPLIFHAPGKGACG